MVGDPVSLRGLLQWVDAVLLSQAGLRGWDARRCRERRSASVSSRIIASHFKAVKPVGTVAVEKLSEVGPVGDLIIHN